MEGLRLKLKSNTLATWCEELTLVKRPWCWERLKAGGEGDNRGWDGWMASLTQGTCVWVNSRCWWWIGRPGVLRSIGSQRVRHDWETELHWIHYIIYTYKKCVYIAYIYVYIYIHTCIFPNALKPWKERSNLSTYSLFDHATISDI